MTQNDTGTIVHLGGGQPPLEPGDQVLIVNPPNWHGFFVWEDDSEEPNHHVFVGRTAEVLEVDTLTLWEYSRGKKVGESLHAVAKVRLANHEGLPTDDWWIFDHDLKIYEKGPGYTRYYLI